MIDGWPLADFVGVMNCNQGGRVEDVPLFDSVVVDVGTAEEIVDAVLADLDELYGVCGVSE